jgi:ribokinase
MGHVTVLGSLNYDCIAHVAEFPRPGQTVTASELQFRLGGRGGLQAVAAARLGASVSLIAAVGDDSAGQEYVAALTAFGIEIEAVIQKVGTATGTAFITRNSRVEAQAVLADGANAALTPEDIDLHKSCIARATIFLTQFGPPLGTVVEALKLAPMMGTATCLNPSPWRDDFPWGAMEIDFVIVDEVEARDLLGRVVLHLGDGSWLLPRMEQLAIQTLIVSRGADSTLVFSRRHGLMEIPTLRVAVVDGTGAGDVFAGAFAALWAESRDLTKALRGASAAGTLATLKPGAMEAMPTREKLDAMGA